MKNMMTTILGIILLLGAGNAAQAFDLDSLDHVSVQMPKSAVLSILGKPDDVGELGSGLEVDIYRSNNTQPMVGTGCIYGDGERLVGQSFIFQGEMGRQAAERLQEDGFMLTEEKGDTFRLLGKDDDTGQPLVVHILQSTGLTIVMTFEKEFYDRRVK
jgi:hypothetical protein